MRTRSVDHLERPDVDECDSSRGVLLPSPVANHDPSGVAGGQAAPNRKIVLKEGASFLNGKYRLKKKLGAGGMSQVWAAIEPYSGNFVAIKMLHDQGGNLALRFRQECRFYPKLKHPNIVRMSQAGEDENGGMYIIMELLEGSTIRRVLRSGRLEIRQALHLAVQLAEACAYMHRQGIWHRDLKPENLMVGSTGEMRGHLWVFDFGISKFANPEDAGLNTDELPEVATVLYMAPEQVDGAQRRLIDGRADIYSFGVILYELITARHIFVKENEPTTAVQIMNGHLVARIRPIPHIVPECDEDLWQLVEKCLAKNPAERFQRFEEIVDVLSNMIRSSGPPDHYIVKRKKKEIMRAARARACADSEIGGEESDEQSLDGGGDGAADNVHKRPTAPGTYPALAQEAALHAAQSRAGAKPLGSAGTTQPEQHPEDPGEDNLGVETPRVVRPTEPMPLAFQPPRQVLPFDRSTERRGGSGTQTDELPSALVEGSRAAHLVHVTTPLPSHSRQEPRFVSARPTVGAPVVESTNLRAPEFTDGASSQVSRSQPVSTLDPVSPFAFTEPVQRQLGTPPSSLTPMLTMSNQPSSSPISEPAREPSVAAPPRSHAYAPAVAIGMLIALMGSGAVLLTRSRAIASSPTAATTAPTIATTTRSTSAPDPQPAPEAIAPASTVELLVPAPTAAPLIAPTASPIATAEPVASATPPSKAAGARPPAPTKPAARPVKPAPQPSTPSPLPLLFDWPHPKKGESGLLDLEDNAQPQHAAMSGSLRHA